MSEVSKEFVAELETLLVNGQTAEVLDKLLNKPEFGRLYNQNLPPSTFIRLIAP